jgi:hypothetical protein
MLRQGILYLSGWVLVVNTLSAQAVGGTATSKELSVPLGGVSVLLLGSDSRPKAMSLTDSVGSYHITATSPGTYRLAFYRRGLETVEVSNVKLQRGAEIVVDAQLAREITALPTVSIIEKSEVDRLPGNTHKYDEFFRRRSQGIGHFLTRADLDAKPRLRMPDVFNGIPGIKVRTSGSSWHLQSQRCSGSSIPGLDEGALGGPSAGRRSKLLPMVFIDGQRAYDFEELTRLSPGEVEAVEIYQGASQMPAEAKGDACFAVFVWLRR